jgi:uncharacterized metal-binding protein
MPTLTRLADVEVRRTSDTESSYRLAAALPDYFNAAGLEHMKSDLTGGELFGAYLLSPALVLRIANRRRWT